MITLKDIAKLTNLSVATVSKAINDYPGVNQETKAKVLQVVKEKGYVPNGSARQLITRKSQMVGVVFTENLDLGLEHPFYGGVLEGFRQCMNSHNYDVIFISANNNEMTFLEKSYHRQLDGVYVCTFAGDDHSLHQLFESKVPCVSNDILYKNVPTITSDNEKSIEDAYRYLYELGHKDIIHINGPLDTISARERLNGFCEACREYGVFPNRYNIYEAMDYNFESGYKAAEFILQNREDKLPDAIIAASDTIAAGAMARFREEGILIPKDISIIGVDNILLSEENMLNLTTMAQDRRGLGELTAKTLLKMIDNQPVESRQRLKMNLIVRGTTTRKSS